jgi:hypothetical protein
MNHKRNKLMINKQDTSSTNNLTTDLTEDLDSYQEDTESEYTIQDGGGAKAAFVSMTNSKYRKPASGSRQDNMTKDDITKKLEGYIPLKTMQEKNLLTQLPLFKTWVRYINKETRQFRAGGLLMKVVYPDYITLVNTAKSLTWSVQLKDNIIFVRDPKDNLKRNEEKDKEQAIKDKLYQWYQNGELARK